MGAGGAAAGGGAALGATTGGMTATEGGGTVWSGGGAPAPGPDGGARLTAAPGSGTEAGGTGGGRSPNNCAAAGVSASGPDRAASTSTGSSHPPRASPGVLPLLLIITLLLTENAANSSLGSTGAIKRRFPANLVTSQCTRGSWPRTSQILWGLQNFKSAASAAAWSRHKPCFC